MQTINVAAHHSSPARNLAALGKAALDAVVESGLLRCAVPVGLGGSGGGVDSLHDGARRLAGKHPAAGWALWVQRSAIEALVQSPNIGVRDCLLPNLQWQRYALVLAAGLVPG